MNLYNKIFLAILFSIIPLYAIAQHKKIVTVNYVKGIHFDSEGHFYSNDDAVRFLGQAAKEGKVSKNFNTIKAVRKLSKESAEGLANEQLLLVKCQQDDYIIKEIRRDKDPRGEIARLEHARQAQSLQEYIHPKNKGKLQFIFPLSYLRYIYNDKEHILVVMPRAKGERLQSIMEKFKNNPYDRNVIALACRAYDDLGNAMGKFYQHQGNLDHTIVHNDFHHGNIMYDAKQHLITLVDNERISRSLNSPTDISSDLGYLFVTSPFVIEWAHPEFIKGLDVHRWYKISLTSFILGFMRAYPHEQRLDVFKKVMSLLLRWNVEVNKDASREMRGIIKEILINNDKNDQNLERQLLHEGKSLQEIRIWIQR